MRLLFRAGLKKDLRQIQKRGYKVELLQEVVDKLASGQSLEPKYRNHALAGDYNGFWECHITPDWLLIYQIKANELVLLLSRTGTHSDLF